MYRFCVNVYGCQMNVYDADRIRTALTSRGWVETSEEAAEVVLFVTCSIRDKAEQKVWSDIGRLTSPQGGPTIAVVGCMAQRVGPLLLKRFTSVKLIGGPRSLGKLRAALERVMETGKAAVLLDEDRTVLDDLPEAPLVRSNRWKAFITIAHGCDNFCTYCIVPYVRGRFVSRNPDDIFREVERLVADGVREITLIGQNVNTYGKDFRNGYVFSNLLRDVAMIKGVERLRYATSHPRDLTRDVVEVMAEHENICTAINLPIQSGSDRILQAMNRGYTVEGYAEIIEMIRSGLREAAVTSDLIVGFPGETLEDFHGSVKAVERFRFDLVHTAAFSPREGTPAARMEHQVEASEKRRRLKEINAVQAVIAREINQDQVGKTFTVLVDGPASKGEGLLQGRTPSDKVVLFPGDPAMIGLFAEVKVTGAGNWHLVGEPVPDRQDDPRR